MYSQNLSSRAGGAGKWAKFSPMEAVKSPKRLLPPNAETPMLDGMNQPAAEAIRTVGSFLIQLVASASARTTTAFLPKRVVGLATSPAGIDGREVEPGERRTCRESAERGRTRAVRRPIDLNVRGTEFAVLLVTVIVHLRARRRVPGQSETPRDANARVGTSRGGELGRTYRDGFQR